MVQDSRQQQTQALQQKQTLSAQQVMAVRLLESPIIELENKIRAELLDNPALEEKNELSSTEELNPADPSVEEETLTAQEIDLGDYKTEDDIPDYKLQIRNYSNEEQAENIPFSESVTFQETLKQQLQELTLNPQEKGLAEYLICSFDDDGFIRKSLTDLTDELAIYMDIETSSEELERILHILQELEPAGIGARSLQECLLIQLGRKEKTPLLELQQQIIQNYYTEFTNKHWDKLAKRLKISTEKLEEAIKEITKLNPRPGSALGESINGLFQQIIPDFIIENDEDNITCSLNNQQTPSLHISNEYLAMVQEQARHKKDRNAKNALLFLKQKIDAAQGFINAIEERQSTLLRTMQAIIKRQTAFFLEGDETLLRPMILKDIAEDTGLDISTVSRVNNSKYAQTNFGIYPLKFFFSDGYTSNTGEERSTREIKKNLQELIAKEDKKAPLSDDELSIQLKKLGFPVARRTVAKYRQQLSIPVARLRK